VIRTTHSWAVSGKQPESDQPTFYYPPVFCATATPSCAVAVSAFSTAAAICWLIIATLGAGRWIAELISRQSEHADPGIRLTVLYREAETGKRIMGSAQAISILADVPITNFR
jgi:hypothetical protein